MKIAVCVKQVVTREWPVRVDAAGTWVRDEDASWALNEPDAYALEEALRLKDARGAEVVVVTAGPARVTQVLREALARGADRAIHVEGEAAVAADPLTTADALAHALRDERPDLVLTGLQSDDLGHGQVGVILAERLALSHATLVARLDADDNGITVTRELEGGWFQRLAVPLPAALTVQSGINQLRYATLKGIMGAKRKEIRTIAPPSSPAARQRIVAVRVPSRAREVRLLPGTPAEAARALVTALRDDAHVR